jgi:hypothetical protein
VTIMAQIILAPCEDFLWKTAETSRPLYRVVESTVLPPGNVVAAEPQVFPPIGQVCTYTLLGGPFQAVCVWTEAKDKPLVSMMVFVLTGLSW